MAASSKLSGTEAAVAAQVISSASTARRARQKLSAVTAIAPGSRWTPKTPGIARTVASLATPAGSSPARGACTTAARSMPGTATSMP